MRRDPTEFRARFKAYKEGKMPYDAGLPKFAEGTGGVENNITEEYTPLASNVYLPMVNNAKQKIAKFAIDDYVYRVLKLHPEITREQVLEVYNNTPYIGSDSRKGTTVGLYWHGEDDGYGRRVMIYPRSMRSDDPEFNLLNRIYSTVLHESNHLFRDAVLGGKYTDKEREYLEAAYPGVPINEAAALNAQIREKLSTVYGNGATGKKLDATLEKVRQNKGMLNEMMFHRNNLNEYGHADKINGQWDSKIIDAMTNALINVAAMQSKPSRGLIRAKNGKLPKYGDGKVNWPRWDNALITSYTIPFIEDKSIKLTNAGRATGAVLSTNLLDSLADNAMRAGVPVRTAIGLATKESTLGNPTDDRSAWNLSSRIRKLFNEVYPGTVQHINDGTNLVDGIKLINYHKGDINHEMFNGTQGKSIIQEGLEFYKTHPDKYNPGLKGYQKAVDARGNEVMNSPEVKKWYKEWEAKQMKIMRPKSYKIETNILNTAAPKFGAWKDGKLPGYGGGKIPYVASDGTQYNIDPNVVGSDQINITTPDVVVTGTDRRPMYQRYDAENSTYDPNAVRMFTDWAPIISDVGDGLDAYNAFKNKDWSLFGIIAGAALLPNVVEKALQPVLRFVLPIAKRYISPLVDKYISPTMDRLFSNTKQLSLPSSETSLRITDDDFNFDFSPSLEDSRATAVRNATEQSVLDAFDSRLPYAKNTNGPLVRAVPATMENNKKLVDHFLLLIKEKYPGVSDEEAKKLFEQIHEASVDDVLYARGMTVRDPVTHEVKFVSYNNQGSKMRSAATKTHEENHTLYDLSPDRFLHHTVTVLDSPLGVKKNYLNEEAGYSLPKNISNPNDYDGVEEYLSADEVSSFMSEAKSLLGKTEDEALTEGDIKWFIKNNNIIGDRLLLRSVYKSIAEHITNAKKFALWCNDYSNVVAALAIGGAATAAATMPEYADGKLPGYKNGKIHIKPANRGKFTALKKRTGHSASWFKAHGTPAQKKMAVFALNAKKWKH